jgi:hypothetical protein
VDQRARSLAVVRASLERQLPSLLWLVLSLVV